MIKEKIHKLLFKKHNNLLLLIAILGTASLFSFMIIFAVTQKSDDATRRTSLAAASSGSLKLTIDQTKIDSSLSDFPLLVHLGTTSGLNSFDASAVFAALGSDANRKKISVTTENGTQLYVEIEKWDTVNQQAWLWVKVPSISSAQDTILYLTYDPNRTDNIAYVGDTGSIPAQNVWYNGYVAVYHMNDQGTVAKDSTGRHNGTRTGTFGSVEGPIGPAANFPGNSYITIPDDDAFSLVTTGHLLISAWLSPNQDVMPTEQGDEGIRLLAKAESGNHEWLLDWHNKGGERSLALSFYACNLAGGLCTGEYFYPYSDTRGQIPVGTWKHPVGRLDESAAVINGVSRTHWVSTYWDGLFKYGQALDETVPVNPQNGNAPVKMGRNDYTNSWWYGKLDEVRIESAARSDAWIKADDYAQNDKLLTYTASATSASPTAMDPTLTPTPTYPPSISVEPSLVTSPIPTTPTSSSLPVGYWKFNENTGTIAYDSSNNSNAGTIYGATWTTGKAGSSLQFNGSNSYVDIGNSSILNPKSAITVDGWVKLADKTSFQDIIRRGPSFSDDAIQGPYALGIYNNKLYWDIGNGATRSSIITDISPLAIGSWIHLAATFDGTKQNIYINGSLYYTGISTVTYMKQSSDSVTIGGTRPFKGTLDEVKIYNRALSASEILADYNITPSTPSSSPTNIPTPSPTPTTAQTSTAQVPNSISLVAYWKLNEYTGNNAYDSSGNGNTGTIYRATWTTGKIGSALNFSGKNNYVDAGNKTNLQITGALTLEGWVKLNSLSANSGLFGRGHAFGSPGNYGYFLSYYAPTKSIYFDTYSTTERSAISKTNAIVDNNWHHIAATWDGTTSTNGMKLYIDGRLIAQKTSDITSIGIPPSYNFRIGRDSNGNYPAKATIDEVKVYNRALSASEILTDYNSGLGFK